MLNQGLIIPVSKIEAENALKTAEEFVKIVLKLVQKENPQLRFNFTKLKIKNNKAVQQKRKAN